jgi:hypothetical protein
MKWIVMKKVHILINANNAVIITKIMIFFQKKQKTKTAI